MRSPQAPDPAPNPPSAPLALWQWLRRRVASLLPAKGPRADGAAPPAIRWAPRAGWLYADGTPLAPAEVERRSFCFDGETHAIVAGKISASASPEWHGAFHAHGFLFGTSFETARAFVRDYDAQRLDRYDAAWSAATLPRRAGAWLVLFFGRWSEETRDDDQLATTLWLHLRRMARRLERLVAIEADASAQIECAAALALLGAAFHGPLAQRWRRRGLRVFQRALDNDVLADGGNARGNPADQQRTLFLLGQLLNTGDDELRAACAGTAARMAAWLQVMTHPDGTIALFQGAVTGRNPETDALVDWLAELGIAPELACEHGPGWASLQPSGYFTAKGATGDAFVMDARTRAAGDGSSSRPGGIEVSFGGHRFVTEDPVEASDGSRPDVERRATPRTTLTRHDRRLDGAHVFRATRRDDAGGGTSLREATWTETGILHLREELQSGTPSFASRLRIDGSWRVEVVDSHRLRFEREGVSVWVVAAAPIDVRPCRRRPRPGDPAAHLLQQEALPGEPRCEGVRWTLCQDRRLAEAGLLFGRALPQLAAG